MNPDYAHIAPSRSGHASSNARFRILRRHLARASDRTTSYVGGTRNGPREILLASSHLELWDEEVNTNTGVGIFTLPEMELPFGRWPTSWRRFAAWRRC